MITQMLGGEVKAATTGGEYGRMPMDISLNSKLFSYLNKREVNVWMSHGDEAEHMPDGFTVVAKSRQGAIVAIENHARRIYGFQFHPEVGRNQMMGQGGHGAGGYGERTAHGGGGKVGSCEAQRESLSHSQPSQGH